MVGRLTLYAAFVLMQSVGSALVAASLSLPGPHTELAAYLYYANIFIKPNISKAAPGVRAKAIAMVTRLVYRDTTALESPPPVRRVATLKSVLPVVTTSEVSSGAQRAMLPCPMVGQEVQHLLPVESVIRMGLERLTHVVLSPEVRSMYGLVRLEVEVLLDALEPVDKGKQWIASLKQLDSTEGRLELFDDCRAMATETTRIRKHLLEFHSLLNVIAPADVG